MPKYRIALASLALLALSTAPPASAAQEATTDPAQQAAEAARQAAERPRFDPSSGFCQNVPAAGDSVVESTRPRTWQVSAPRSWPGPTHPGDMADIGLRDKFGAASRLVYADVYRPDGTSNRAGAILFGDGWGKLPYPKEFRDAQPLTEGVYTVIWRDTQTDGYIACDGFVVER